MDSYSRILPSILSSNRFRVNPLSKHLFCTSSELGSSTELRTSFLFDDEDPDEYGLFIYSETLREDIPMVVEDTMNENGIFGWVFAPLNDEYFNKFPHLAVIWNI